MGFELTFWDLFGPRILFSAVVLLVGGGVWLIARSAASAYERTAVRQADDFNGLTKKTRKAKREAYTGAITEMLEKGRQARKISVLALTICVTLFGFFALGTAIEFATNLNTTIRAGVALVGAVAAATLTFVYGRRAAERRARTTKEEVDIRA